jgi:hypothetical protein
MTATAGPAAPPAGYVRRPRVTRRARRGSARCVSQSGRIMTVAVQTTQARRPRIGKSGQIGHLRPGGRHCGDRGWPHAECRVECGMQGGMRNAGWNAECGVGCGMRGMRRPLGYQPGKPDKLRICLCRQAPPSSLCVLTPRFPGGKYTQSLRGSHGNKEQPVFRHHV